MKYFFVALVLALFISSCGGDKDYVLVTRELNTIGVRHTVDYNGSLPSRIIYETFHGTGSRDTTTADSVLRREIDSVRYDLGSRTIMLTRLLEEGQSLIPQDFRKYYFNDDNLLQKITRFSSGSEYTSDSVAYDYTTQTALFYDLINKHVFELVYDNRSNVESETEKRMADQHVYHTNYYYYDASSNPFHANLDDDEQLFGCFHIRNISLFWNNATRPVFSSKNNVQSFKEVQGNEEHNGLFEYQYRHGLPLVQFGNDGVIYYRYTTFTSGD